MKLHELHRIWLLENIEAKRPYLEKEIYKSWGFDDKEREYWQKDINTNIEHLVQADPIARKTNGKKTPFVNVILKWVLDRSVTFPEDIEKVNEILTKYQHARNNEGFRKDIGQFKTYSDLAKELLDIEGVGYNTAELVETSGDYKLYKISNFDQGKICFADSGWCVQHEHAFDEYNPPFFMVVNGKKRYALIHVPTLQIKDVYDEPLSYQDAIPIIPFLKLLFGNMENVKIDHDHVSNNDFVNLWGQANALGEEDEVEWMESNPSIALEAALSMDDPEDALAYYGYAIIKDPATASWFAEKALGNRWVKAEDRILDDIWSATRYAIRVIGERWPAYEERYLSNNELPHSDQNALHTYEEHLIDHNQNPSTTFNDYE